MDTFLLNAQRIFDVARADSSGSDDSEFELLICPDGALRMFMGGAERSYEPGIVYVVTRSSGRVRVTGENGCRRCELEENTGARFRADLLRDQPLYSLSSPLLT